MKSAKEITIDFLLNLKSQFLEKIESKDHSGLVEEKKLKDHIEEIDRIIKILNKEK